MVTRSPTFGETLFTCRTEGISRAQAFIRSGEQTLGLLQSAIDRARAIRCDVTGITQDVAGAEELVKRLTNHDIVKFYDPRVLRGPA